MASAAAHRHRRVVRRMVRIDLLRGRCRRPDRRSHRKLLAVDCDHALAGAYKVIDLHHGSKTKSRSRRSSGWVVRRVWRVAELDP